MNANEKVYVKTFSGATVEDMVHHAKPSQLYTPDLFILHVGTNSLRSSKTPCEISNDILKLAIDLKTDKNEVLISGIIKRNDKWNEKGEQVNAHLKMKYSHLGLGYVDNSNVSHKHLNGSGIHLNSNGTNILANNFLRAMNV